MIVRESGLHFWGHPVYDDVKPSNCTTIFNQLLYSALRFSRLFRSSYLLLCKLI